MDSLEERLMNIEILIANQEKMLEELNQVIISQADAIDFLKKQNTSLMGSLEQGEIKSLSEEAPPPHY